MTKLQKIGFSSIALLTWVSQTLAINFGENKVQSWLWWGSETVDNKAQGILTSFIAFLWIVAVFYWVYGGFLILTAAWDDGKVKKWRTIIIQALLWILVIFLAYSIVNWFIKTLVWTWGN